MKKYSFLFITLFTIFSYSAKAQILNADRFGSSVDSTKFLKAAFDFGMKLDRQKTVILSFNTKLDLSYWFKNNILIVVGKFNLFRSGSSNILNGGYGHLRLRLAQNNWVHPEIFTQYQLDGVRGMRERILAGANARFRVIEYDKGRFDIGLGYMYENENWDYTGVADDVIVVDDTPIRNHYTKANIYLSYVQAIGKAVTTHTMIYYQARPDINFIKPRLSLNLNLDFKITKHVRFIVKYGMIYDAAPIVPIYNVYYSMLNTIRFRF